MNRHKRLIKKSSVNGGILLVAGVLSLFLAEVILAVLSFPTEFLSRVSHPADFEELRSTIEFQYTFKTNNRGLRYDNIPAEKPANSHRVFVIGDSFTEGWGVATGKRFTDLLENSFNFSPSPVLFINGGLAGTGPLEYGKLFLNVGLDYNPDGLLICLYVNDVTDTPEKIGKNSFSATLADPAGIKKIAHDVWPRTYALLYTLREWQLRHSRTRTSDFIKTISQEARNREIPESDIKRWKESLPPELVNSVNQGRFEGGEMANGLLRPNYWTDSIDISSDVAKNKWKNMTRLLSEILARADQSGIETAMVFIPSGLLYDKRKHSEQTPGVNAGPELHDEWLYDDTQIQIKLRQWTTERDIPFLDLTPVFRKAIQSNQDLNFELDEHWTDLGHQVAADAIASWLSNRQIFSLSKNDID